MPSQKDQQVKREERRAKVSALYVRGYTETQIAKMIKTSQPTVHRDLQLARGAWRDKMIADIGDAIAMELQHIAAVQTEAWEGWFRSIEHKTAEKTKLIESVKHGDTKSIEKAIEWQVGNPAFLTTLLTCSERRSKLLGLDEAEKHDHRFNTEDKTAVQSVAETIRHDPGYAAFLHVAGGDGSSGFVRGGSKQRQVGNGDASSDDQPGHNGNGNGKH